MQEGGGYCLPLYTHTHAHPSSSPLANGCCQKGQSEGENKRKCSRISSRSEGERQTRGAHKSVNGLFVIKELVYFQARRSNRRETHRQISLPPPPPHTLPSPLTPEGSREVPASAPPGHTANLQMPSSYFPPGPKKEKKCRVSNCREPRPRALTQLCSVHILPPSGPPSSCPAGIRT